VVQSGVRTEVLADGSLRLGLQRLKGLSAGMMGRLVAARAVAAFGSVEDLAERVGPTMKERRVLAAAGALNALPEVGHRRQAMWPVELPFHGDLLTDGRNDEAGVLPAMSVGERVAADFSVQGATTGPHLMRLWRENSGTRGVQRARDLAVLPTGVPVVVAGMAICRQRPGTAKGHCFISLEDETGIANLFVPKTTFHRLRRVITGEAFLLARGRLQRSEGDQPTVYVTEIEPLPGADGRLAARAHDFR